MSQTTPNIARVYPEHFKVEKGKKYYWCSCGMSAKQPFCDGAHKGTDMRPVEYVANETKKVLFCMCKQTKKQPLCDLSHLGVIRRMYGTQIGAALAVGVAGAVGAYTYLFKSEKKAE